MATLQHDVFEANVYVMTPKGRVIDLPNGATPIDFAYRVHTDVGHTAVGAIVNNVMVPLNTELHTGDVVQIKTLKGTGPSEDWLKFVKTNQAKNKIKAYLTRKENENKIDRVEDGEKIMYDELRRRGFDAKEYKDRKKYEAIMKTFNVYSYVDLMYGIAVKSINPTDVCQKLTNQKRSIRDDDVLNRVMNREPVKRRATSKFGVVIPGIESMKMSLAGCCMPVYGDPIIGYISKGVGVKVHRADCPNMQGVKERRIDVQWDDGNIERTYASDLLIKAHDRQFLITDIVTVVSQLKAPMNAINAVLDHESLITTVKMQVNVRNLEHLNALIANIRKVESVVSVSRASH